jgi:hypothetical protein
MPDTRGTSGRPKLLCSVKEARTSDEAAYPVGAAPAHAQQLIQSNRKRRFGGPNDAGLASWPRSLSTIQNGKARLPICIVTHLTSVSSSSE